jgi:hypothetical protein
VRRLIVVPVCLLALVATARCGKSPQEKQAEQVQKGAEAMAKGLEQMAKGLQTAAESATAAGQSGEPVVDPVSFRDLQAAFGDMGGWQKGKATGERMTSPVNYSEARITYTKGDAEIEANISDSAFNQLLLVPFSMFLTTNYEKETESGYERATKIGDYPGWEKWDGRDKSGELNAIVNKRFIVQVHGRNVGDAKALRDAMASVDLKKLAALK